MKERNAQGTEIKPERLKIKGEDIEQTIKTKSPAKSSLTVEARHMANSQNNRYARTLQYSKVSARTSNVTLNTRLKFSASR